jgi:hypothetical protein
MSTEALCDQGAALIASCLVAKSDKIESTHFAVDLWSELRDKLAIETRFDYLVAILSVGRLLDLRIDKKNYIDQVIESQDIIKHELVLHLTYPILGEKNGTEMLANAYIVRLNDIAAAMMASAITDLSEKVETSKEIIELWGKIRDMEIVKNNNEYLTSLFVTSRINDLKKEIQHSGGLNVIIENFKNLLNSIEPNLKVTKVDLAAGYLTIAVVTQTVEIESHAQILDIWRRFKEDLELNNMDRDIIASMLTSGLIRNMKSKLDLTNVKDIFTRVWYRLQETKLL